LAAGAGVTVSLALAWIGAYTVEPLSIGLGKFIDSEVFRPRNEADSRALKSGGI
jgi:hypothetical protein